MGRQRGRRFDPLRVWAAKTDGVSSRLARRLAQGAPPEEIASIRREYNAAHAGQWAEIVYRIGEGVPPAAIAERAGVEPADVERLAEAMRRAKLGLRSGLGE